MSPPTESRPLGKRAADVSADEDEDNRILTALRTHGRDCTPRCRELAVPSPWDRDTPPQVKCGWCGAPPGIACVVPAPWARRGTTPLQRFGRIHPSRLEEAAA